MVRVERLVLKLLGGFQARVEGGEPVDVPGRKAQALLAFLASPPGVEHARDKLAALLWPDMPAAQARANLRLNLFGLRRALAFADCLRLERDTVALDAARVDVDAVAFERALARGGPDDLASALASYRGDLLAGLRTQEPSFEEWLLAERERLRERAIEGLARLLGPPAGRRSCRRGDPDGRATPRHRSVAGGRPPRAHPALCQARAPRRRAPAVSPLRQRPAA